MTGRFNYDYSKTLWMKMYLATPDFTRGVSDLKISFEEALGIIKTVDALTQGIEKIVYLVGWQGLGHDDCYPEMHKVNDFLKRDCDRDGRESLLWLIGEAKKFHTVVSVHGNLADEYGENESHPEFVRESAIVKHPDGEPAVIEVFNGRNAYKISYKQFWESGLFKKYWEKFLETVPVREAGTVHLDNFCIAENFCPRTTVEEQDAARNAILDYIRGEGIDVTSEYTYRELELRSDEPSHPIRKFYAQHVDSLPVASWRDAPMRTLGRIPATWWTSGVKPEECLTVPPSLYSGHLTDGELGAVYYGAMHGEDIWMSRGIRTEDWTPAFLKEFCTYQLPYFYLNRYERTGLEKGEDGHYTASFSEGVESRGSDRSIWKNGILLKQGGDVILPLKEDNRLFIAYSENGRAGRWELPDAAFSTCRIYEITPEGNCFLCTRTLENGGLDLDLKPGRAVALEAGE